LFLFGDRRSTKQAVERDYLPPTAPKSGARPGAGLQSSPIGDKARRHALRRQVLRLHFLRQCFGRRHRNAMNQAVRLRGEYGIRLGVRLSNNCYRSVAVWAKGIVNSTGEANTALGFEALFNNTRGGADTAIGAGANVSAGNLNNATAIGAGAFVNASNKVRLGSATVTVIEGQVAFTAVSDKTKKENFQPVDGEAVLGKIRGFELSSWNFIGHDPKEFRHYDPMAQDFFAAFGQDGVGQIGSETTINSGDLAGILMIAVQALEKRTAEKNRKRRRLRCWHRRSKS